MIIVDSPLSTFEPLIFSIKGAVSKKAITCEFIFLDDKNGVVTSKDGQGRDINAVVKFSIVDGKYPDYKKVVPKAGGNSITEIGFNIGYLADVNKSALALGSKLTHGVLSFYDKKVVINIKTPENKAKCIIMATRGFDDEESK